MVEKRSKPPELTKERLRRPLSLKAYFALQVEEMAAVKEYVENALAPLKKRISELEAAPSLKYVGTWQQGRVYGEGNVVTADGSMWVAKKASLDKPGTSDHWQLCVKRGRDARGTR